jgi:hypothetical protein
VTVSGLTIEDGKTASGQDAGDTNVSVVGNHKTLKERGGNGGNGGGIYNTAAGNLTLTDDTVTGNPTGSGGNPASGDVTFLGTDDALNLSSGGSGTGDDVYPPGSS